MIRCIEGHIFDADKSAKCPICGWTPQQKAASKSKLPLDKQSASLRQLLTSLFHAVRAVFNTLTVKTDDLLKSTGIPVRPAFLPG